MIDIQNLSVQFTGVSLFENVNLRINKGDKICLVGSNGTGKSTFLKLLNGKEQPETGNISYQNKIKIGYLPQEFTALKGNTLFDEVKNSLSSIKELEEEESEIIELLHSDNLKDEDKQKLLIRQGQINHRKEEIDYYSIDAEIEKTLEGLGFSSNDFSRLTDEFSGGWQMRIELSKVLLNKNDVILLDEPTNHLDIDSLRWLVDFLKNFSGTLIVVSHDKFFVNNVTNKTLEIFNKNISFFEGNLDHYYKFKEERKEQLEAEYIQQQKKIKDTQKFIERFRYKASKAKQVQSRVKQLEKLDKIDIDSNKKDIRISFPEPPRGGRVPIKLENIHKAYGDNVVFDGNEFDLERGDKVAFVGPNGAGKTTFAKIIANKTNIDDGEITLGHNTSISYYAQEVADNLDQNLDLIESLDSVGSDKTVGQLRTLLGSFLFSDDDVFKKVKVLSGGEKSRVALAQILLKQVNLIILDEPTNHLDFDSKKVLQDALVDFSGTLIIVSHDIEFLRPIVNKVFEFRNRQIKEYYGGIDYYLNSTSSSLDEPIRKSVKANNGNVSKKELKRIEAELRQKKYKATKELNKDIEKLERDIETLENKKTQLEEELADPKVFSNSELSKQKNKDYEKVKSELDETFISWTEKTEELENIEEEFKAKAQN